MLQSRVHIVVVREIRAKIGLGRRCVESMVEYDQIQRALHSQPLSSLMPQRPISHRNACELSLMEAMVRMADNGMSSNMYRCVRFPRSAKNMVL